MQLTHSSIHSIIKSAAITIDDPQFKLISFENDFCAQVQYLFTILEVYIFYNWFMKGHCINVSKSNIIIIMKCGNSSRIAFQKDTIFFTVLKCIIYLFTDKIPYNISFQMIESITCNTEI